MAPVDLYPILMRVITVTIPCSPAVYGRVAPRRLMRGGKALKRARRIGELGELYTELKFGIKHHRRLAGQ